MKFKKVMMAGAATALFVGSVLNVSAAKTASAAYVNALKESNNENLILNVEAYKAAYPDLAAAFGDDTDAYLEHYLTIGVYEGRTKGVLFDPLAYAEAYKDVKSAYGSNIAAIIDHYLTFGIAENRTAGTACGYADIAEAEKKGVAQVAVQREAAWINNGQLASQTALMLDNGAVYNTANSSIFNSSITTDGNTAVPVSNSGNIVPTVNNAGNTVTNNVSAGNNATADTNVAADNTAASTNAAPAPADTTASIPPQNTNTYDHTTSIYTNDESTLLRVEYYDKDNNLCEFSQVTNHDSATNSYTEDVYYTDKESGEIVHDRTDTYVNGVLSSSEKH